MRIMHFYSECERQIRTSRVLNWVSLSDTWQSGAVARNIHDEFHIPGAFILEARSIGGGVRLKPSIDAADKEISWFLIRISSNLSHDIFISTILLFVIYSNVTLDPKQSNKLSGFIFCLQ
jgi:hypothetical protein